MHIDLADVFTGYIQEKVRSGLYGNGSEVIRDALRRMMESEKDAASEEKFLSAVRKGLDQLDSGHSLEYDFKFREAAKNKAGKMSKNGIKPKLDVIP